MIGLLLSLPAHGGEWSGNVSAELRSFMQTAQAPMQHDNTLSIATELEYYHEWDDGRQSITFTPFFRIDQHDSRRTNADLRELMWVQAGDNWELQIGVGKVFWGVTEAVHLVDIINQTDLVENPDGEQKLGQPMIKISLEREWGTVDMFAMPGFRARTFPGKDGRLRSHPQVNPDGDRYESAAKKHHTDLALRWSHSIEDWDVGLSHFWGTSRDPRMLVTGAVFTPYYEIIHQTSLDLQATKGDWLWKLEALRRSGQGKSYYAVTGGFEYTEVGVFGASDLGLLLEYMVDDRRESAPTPFQDDLFFAFRWTANDSQSTEILAGMILDRDSGARMFNVEASRRLGSDWKLSVQGRGWGHVPGADPLHGMHLDDYLEVNLARYF
ncbi:FIG01201466: hypothetical protein [hydrothermal vent metagenome]|uniref:Uncharacterized protein n=1 Tax=hydrothermal vent metagenome TaxID=652676 RepID=A0A3B1B0V7_9ZZZZ